MIDEAAAGTPLVSSQEPPSARSGSWLARLSDRRRLTSQPSTDRSLPPASERKAALLLICSAVFGDATRFVLPAASREVMSAGPTPAGLQAAATRMLGEMKAVIRLR